MPHSSWAGHPLMATLLGGRLPLLGRSYDLWLPERRVSLNPGLLRVAHLWIEAKEICLLRRDAGRTQLRQPLHLVLSHLRDELLFICVALLDLGQGFHRIDDKK